jgi:uncharacterized protein (DUF2062 family)
MSGFGNKGKRDGLRENWPSMVAAVAAVGAFSLFGPFVGLAASVAALVFHERRRRQAQD